MLFEPFQDESTDSGWRALVQLGQQRVSDEGLRFAGRHQFAKPQFDHIVDLLLGELLHRKLILINRAKPFCPFCPILPGHKLCRFRPILPAGETTWRKSSETESGFAKPL